MRTHRSLAVALVVLCLPAVSGADPDTVIEARAQAVLAGRPDARDGEIHTIAPLLALVSLRATGATAPGFDDIRVVLSLWGQVDPAEPRDDKHVDGDVDLAYLEGEGFRGRLRLRFGRQLLLGGAARATPFDGLWADARIVKGLGVSAQAGLPVTPRFSIDRGDVLWGGRVYYRHSVDAEVGASYFHSLDDGRVARFDLGVDARWVPAPRWLVGGNLVYSAEEARVAEAQVYAAYDASAKVRVAIDANRTAPDLFLPRSSILSVFSDETRDEAGATVTYRPQRAVRLEGDGRVIHIEDGFGGRASLRAEYRLDDATVGAEARGLKLPGDGYLNPRIFGKLMTGARSTATADLGLYALDRPFNGSHVSVQGTVTWGIQLDDGWRVVASGLAGSDPLYRRRFEAMLRIAKDFVWITRRGQ